ncbi:DUF4861 domain-containing protein [Marinilabilia rubra]|uniref:DUF4861 domain-containing protein n=1 Tax=Marinilabilia rubra TaxID=2162893 RepID=A0A2U2B737_9BACT|nr:DUF4861 domain-containing protein [Marinilabilia rubra]PWD98862.1 DUF4861 domain-containing protein [Marinilabilia rubra]
MQVKTIFILALFAALVAGCKAPQSGYEVTNKLEDPLQDKAVVLTYDEVNQYLPGDIGSDYIVVVDADGNNLPSQCDDLNNDGQWDELAFLVDLAGGENKTVYFDAVPKSEVPDYTKRTNIRFGYKDEPYVEVTDEARLKSTDSPTISEVFQMEGPAWENDKVGFRNYYDARNGIDIYGKRTTEMVLDSAGIRGQNYHELDDWGMDILKVGNSLGAGAIGIRIGDEVSRVGKSEKGTYEFITEGPVRAMFELKYVGVPVGARTYDITHRISICAGDLFYRSKVSVDGLQGDEQLVTGIVNMHQKESFRMEEGDYRILASHGSQAYQGEKLGMAVLVPRNSFVETWKAPDEGEGIVETHMVAIDLEVNTPAKYCFLSGWEYQDEGFKTEDYFREQVVHAAHMLSNKF